MSDKELTHLIERLCDPDIDYKPLSVAAFEAADELFYQAAEIERLRGIVPEVLERLNDELCQENQALQQSLAECVEDSEELLSNYLQAYGDRYRVDRMDHMRERIRRARALLPDPELEWLTGCPECGLDAGCDCYSGTENEPEPVAPLCMCKDRPLTECPGEWEPGCDLGNNPKFVKAYVPTAPTHSDHPLRHWDRTCPACTAASTTSEFPSVIDAKKEAIGQLGYYRQMMGTEAAPTVVEPVAWLYKNKMTQHTTVLVEWIDLGRLASEYESSPLYSTPPRTALTDEELIGKAKARGIHDADAAVCFGRAIEAAHGIGGKQ